MDICFFDRKRIFCHGPFAIATVVCPQPLGLMKPRFRQRFFETRLAYTPSKINIAPSWELPKRKFIFHPQCSRCYIIFLAGCNQNLPYFPVRIIHFRCIVFMSDGTPCNPPTLPSRCTSSKGRIMQPWGQGYMGCMGTTVHSLHPLSKMNTCPLKKGPLYRFYTGQVVFQTPTNHHEFKNPTETLMTHALIPTSINGK